MCEYVADKIIATVQLRCNLTLASSVLLSTSIYSRVCYWAIDEQYVQVNQRSISGYNYSQ